MYKLIKKSNLENVTNILKNMDYSVKSYPYTERGVYQKHYRKIKITNLGRNMVEKIKNTTKLEKSNIDKYFLYF